MNKIAAIPAIIAIATILLYIISINAPKIDEKDTSTIKFPSNLDELKALALTLKQYKTEHIAYVVILFCFALIYKQSFAIPGSFMINILGGAIFGVTIGFPLVCLLTAFGATCCYLLSNFFAKDYILKHFSEKITAIQSQISENKRGLFFVLLSLRLFPMSPNWFMNIVSPILNIPIKHFFFAILVGLMPYNFICVQTGSILSEITSLDDIITMKTFLQLILTASVAFLPSIFIKRLKSKLN